MFSFSLLSWFLKPHSEEVQNDGERVLHSVHNISSLPPHTFPLHQQETFSMAVCFHNKSAPLQPPQPSVKEYVPGAPLLPFWFCCIQGCFFFPYSVDCSAAFYFFFWTAFSGVLPSWLLCPVVPCGAAIGASARKSQFSSGRLCQLPSASTWISPPL